ncbi:MAG: hypothetical protein ACXVY9_04630 [Terriglobales bacterium]
MKARTAFSLLAGAVLAMVTVQAEDKAILATEILQARTVAVVIYPGSEVPLANPGENRTAVSNVEAAILRWGRFTLADATNADLIIAVRKGRRSGPVVTGGDNPVIVNPTDDAVHIGVHSGTPPYRGPAETGQRGPRMSASTGSDDDALLVYRGRTMARQNPFDSAALWRFTGKRALDAPVVPAVAALKKAIESAEKNKP